VARPRAEITGAAGRGPGVKAVILAAGQGTRLRPLTEHRPKCMVDLGGVPLLHHQLTALAQAEVTEVTVVAGFHAEALVAPGAEVIVNRRFASSNMVTSLFCATPVLIGGQDVIISYGDIAYEPRVLDGLLQAEGPLAVAVDLGWRAYWEVRFAEPLGDAETLRLRSDNTIAELGRRAETLDEIEGQYIGLLKLSADAGRNLVAEHERLRRRDPDVADRMYMTDFIQTLIDRGWPVAAATIEHGWLEIDSPLDIRLYDDGALAAFYDDSFLTRRG
jgi:L-glutamine-phosphate cytidylyltransferase